MSAVELTSSGPAGAVRRRPAGVPTAVTALAVRQLRRGVLVVAAVVAGLPAVVVVQYRGTLGASVDPASLLVLAENPAIRMLFGVPVALDDPGGFTVWRTGTILAVLLGAWGLLAATRITRGEEDAGRWDLLLAGRIRLSALVTRHLVVLLASMAAIGAVLALALVVSGAGPTGALLHGASTALVGMVFGALGMLAAQVLPRRSAASGAAAALLGAALLLRMVADGADALAWLRWLTPFGLMAEVQPYAANRVWPLGLLAATVAGLSAGAAAAARFRDAGDGMVGVATRREPRLRLLRSLPGFAVRRTLRPLAGWAAGLGAYFLLIGLLAVSVTEFLTENAGLAALAASAGFGIGSVEGYVAALFGLLGLPVGIFAAGRIAATADDEAQRRLTPLFSLPVRRGRWLGVEAGVTALACTLLLVVAGAATWAGTAAVGATLAPVAALAGVLNLLPVALLCLGAAVLALGWAPRAVAAVGALPAVGGYLLHVLAQTGDWPGWIARLSPFAHVAAVPGTAWDAAGAAGMLVVAAGLGAAGAYGYARRDLRG